MQLAEGSDLGREKFPTVPEASTIIITIIIIIIIMIIMIVIICIIVLVLVIVITVLYPPWPRRPPLNQYSGVRKGGFSKGGLSNLCVILLLLSPNPPLLDPPL